MRQQFILFRYKDPRTKPVIAPPSPHLAFSFEQAYLLPSSILIKTPLISIKHKIKDAYIAYG